MHLLQFACQTYIGWMEGGEKVEFKNQRNIETQTSNILVEEHFLYKQPSQRKPTQLDFFIDSQKPQKFTLNTDETIDRFYSSCLSHVRSTCLLSFMTSSVLTLILCTSLAVPSSNTHLCTTTEQRGERSLSSVLCVTAHLTHDVFLVEHRNEDNLFTFNESSQFDFYVLLVH